MTGNIVTRKFVSALSHGHFHESPVQSSLKYYSLYFNIAYLNLLAQGISLHIANSDPLKRSAKIALVISLCLSAILENSPHGEEGRGGGLN